MYATVVLFHVLGATVWVGGHLVLALTVLPRALRARDPQVLLGFERGFERVGIPALVVQVLTGLWLAQHAVPRLADWFDPTNRLSLHILAKLALLAATLALAANARFRVIPRLRPESMPVLAYHIGLVTLAGVLLVAVGISIRTALLF